MTFEEYEREVKKHLTEKRFYHSQCVAEEAARLAERYGADVEKARLAGILHDIMKDTPKEEQLKILDRFGIILTKIERSNPRLWHAISGAAYLEGALHVTDPEILGAVRCHTSGKGGMSLFEKVLFIADYISADREYPGVEEMRASAYKSLEETIILGLDFTLRELLDGRFPIDPDSVGAYNDALLGSNGLAKENKA